MLLRSTCYRRRTKGMTASEDISSNLYQFSTTQNWHTMPVFKETGFVIVFFKHRNIPDEMLLIAFLLFAIHFNLFLFPGLDFRFLFSTSEKNSLVLAHFHRHRFLISLHAFFLFLVSSFILLATVFLLIDLIIFSYLNIFFSC